MRTTAFGLACDSGCQPSDLDASLVGWCRNVEPRAEAGFTVPGLVLAGHSDPDLLGRQSGIVYRPTPAHVQLKTVWGQEDIVIPVPHAGPVRLDLFRSAVRISPECGHRRHIAKFGDFNDLLSRFLRGSFADGLRSLDR